MSNRYKLVLSGILGLLMLMGVLSVLSNPVLGAGWPGLPEAASPSAGPSAGGGDDSNATQGGGDNSSSGQTQNTNGGSPSGGGDDEAAGGDDDDDDDDDGKGKKKGKGHLKGIGKGHEKHDD
jgi:hypothetical protein